MLTIIFAVVLMALAWALIILLAAFAAAARYDAMVEVPRRLAEKNDLQSKETK